MDDKKGKAEKVPPRGSTISAHRAERLMKGDRLAPEPPRVPYYIKKRRMWLNPFFISFVLTVLCIAALLVLEMHKAGVF